MANLILSFKEWRANRRNKSNDDEIADIFFEDGVGSESPIRTQKQDLFNRVDFANRIADVLSELNLREGRVFAIRGGWGYGKSSLKNLIIQKLNTNDKGADWLDFNPWQWGDGKAITGALFGQIADSLGGEHSKAALKRAEALRRYGRIISGASNPLKKASGSTSTISHVLGNISVITIASAIGFGLPSAAIIAAAFAIIALLFTFIGNLLSYLGRDHSNDSLDVVRSSLESRLRELNKPLVIFVDDIDRLEPEQIRVLLRQVKANANLPNIVFVLLFQPSIVENALAPIADNNGRAFLEKIVQANFDLPALPRSLVHRLLLSELAKIASPFATEENGFSQRRWGNICISCIYPFIHNMRDIRRLVSSMAVHFPLHISGDVFEVNIIDYLLLETIRVFEPNLHSAIFNQRELLLQEGRYSRNHVSRDRDTKSVELLLQHTSVEHQETIRSVLKNLFPPIEWALGGTNYADGFRRQWLAEKMVCSSRYFPRYFELQTSEGELSERRFVDFIHATATENELNQEISEIESAGLLNSLVRRLDESFDRLPPQNASILLPAMFSLAESFAGQNYEIFDSPFISAWRATSFYLDTIPRVQRGDLLLHALGKSQALSVAAVLINLSDPEEREDKGTKDFDPAIDYDTLQTIKAEWLRLVKERAANGYDLIKTPDLLTILYRWKYYSGSIEEPRAWVMNNISTDQGFVCIISRFMSRGSSRSINDYVSTQHNTFDRGIIDEFIGVELVQSKYEEIDLASFPEQKDTLKTLGYHLEKWSTN
ncbi:KAP family P-loop NTPase fold protein [Rosenbergiella epipactidis]|uniref:KAP family P-loop NTPase fold protein n=1 Tax=Rosenbergiella epipactidis TaxID=1544694 RepID=UPI001F4E31F9|nr:P-loop NTPase fold protein [Rosenbergiella epipactidis]